MAPDADDLQQPPAIAVPATFGAELTLPPGGTVELTFVPDQDLLLDGFDFQSDGPTIVRVRVNKGVNPEIPAVHVPGGSFSEYLDRELPLHLAKLVGEKLEDWNKKNETLLHAAVEGADDACFELLARDPSQFSSELAIGRILTWRTAIDRYNQFFRVKLSRLYASQEVASPVASYVRRHWLAKARRSPVRQLASLAPPTMGGSSPVRQTSPLSDQFSQWTSASRHQAGVCQSAVMPPVPPGADQAAEKLIQRHPCLRSKGTEPDTS